MMTSHNSRTNVRQPRRREALIAIAGLALLPIGCSGQAGGPAGPALKVGSKNFTEELILGEMYAHVLEAAGIKVERKLNLGSTQIAMGALGRSEIDLYPEYTGTALLVVLKRKPLHDRKAVYDLVKREYEQRFKLTWLSPAPMNDTQALATTQTVSQKYSLRTLSDCSRLAPQLRLGAIRDFIERPDGLPGLQQAYGGFKFKSVQTVDIGLKYKALLDGDVDVVLAFGTDGQIDADHLIVLDDDKHFFPPYPVAPVVRLDALARFPGLAPALNRLAPLLTDPVMRHLNWRVDGNHEEPADVAAAYLKEAKLI
jgi:osmoprotectant transport system substrate-binding protein